MPEITVPVSSRLFYRVMGSGPAIVLLHGFPESGTLWRRVQDALAASFTLIIPDFPGSGNSILDEATSISQMADAVNRIMDAEGIDRAIITGHSMGGYVAFEFAARYPSRVAGLSIVHSTAAADDEEKKTVRRKAIRLIQNGGGELFIRQMVANLFAPAFKQSDPQIVEEQTILSLEVADNALVNYYNAMIDRNDHLQTLKGLNFPVQWVIGKEDNVIHYQKILEQCYKSQINFVTFYENCGHMSMLEVPVQLASDLLIFFNYTYNSYGPQ